MEATVACRVGLDNDPREWPDEQLVTLTEEEVARWVEIQAACVGVELLPPDPGPKPVIEMPAPDTAIYRMKFGWRFSIDFVDADSATRLRDVLVEVSNKRTEALTEKDVEHIADTDPGEIPGVEARRVYSATQWRGLKDLHARLAKDLERWEKASKEYGRVRKERAAIEMELRDLIDAAETRRAHIMRAQAVLDQYLKLAEGVREIALVFMANASPGSVAVLGLEAEVEAARNPSEDQKAVRLLRHRVGKIQRLGKEADGETKEAPEEL